MNKHIHKLIEALFTDDDDEMLNGEENIIADKMMLHGEELKNVLNILVKERKTSVIWLVKPEKTFDIPDACFDPKEYFGVKKQDTLDRKFRDFIKRLTDIYKNKGDVNLNWINTKTITTFDYLFDDVRSSGMFDISRWDTSNVISLNYTFSNSDVHLNSNVSDWDTKNVLTMDGTFHSTSSGDNVKNWNVSNVVSMKYCFGNGTLDSDLSHWQFTRLNDISHAFESSKGIHFDISTWNTKTVEDMDGLFKSVNADDINLNLSYIENINTDNVKRICKTFESFISSKPLNLNKWNTVNCTKMFQTFYKSLVRVDISNWNTLNVETFQEMFKESQFDGDIDNWNVESVHNTANMFSDSPFSGKLTNWNIKNMSAFNSNDYVKSRLFSKSVTGLNTMTIQEVIDLMLTIESEPDPYWKNSRRNVIRPKNDFMNIKLRVV